MRESASEGEASGYVSRAEEYRNRRAFARENVDTILMDAWNEERSHLLFDTTFRRYRRIDIRIRR